MKEQDILDRALADLFEGKPVTLLGYILGAAGVTPEMLEIKKVVKQEDYRKQLHKKAFDRISQEHARGNLFATAYLGRMHEKGWGTKQNPTKAWELFEKSAQGNNPLGYSFVASSYMNGIEGHKSLKIDQRKGIEWLKKGAAVNHWGCLATLGLAHENGDGVEKSLAEANRFYLAAAKAGNPWALNNLTERGQNVTGIPFIFFFPKNLDFTYEVLCDERLKLTTNFDWIHASYEAARIMVKVTYTGSIDIGEQFTYVKDLPRSSFHWQTIKNSNGFKSYVNIGGMGDDLRKKLESNIQSYFMRKAVAEVICEADSLIMDLIQKAQARPAPAIPSRSPLPGNSAPAYPAGAFFAAQPAVPQGQNSNLPIAPQQPVDPAEMWAIMQTFQQNPVFAHQVAILHRQFQQMQVPAMQPPPQYPQQQFQPPPSYTPK